ncbi:MAG: hypothetical protein ABSF46_06995, partial [Terriglobia bacterium]
MKNVHALFEDAVGFSGIHFVGADLVGDIVNDVADVHGVQNAQEEIEIHLESRFSFGLIQASALLEEQ